MITCPSRPSIWSARSKRRSRRRRSSRHRLRGARDMPPPFPFELVAPEKLIFAGEVEAVVVPGTEGEFTVLKDHAPLMSMLRPGVIEIDRGATKKTNLSVSGGFAATPPA